ncbi:MAG: hypothetical protein ABL883_05690 [Terricaulis sp.]
MRYFWAAMALAACVIWAPPASAQQRSEPSVAAVEATLADIGQWTLEYSAVLGGAGAVLEEIDPFIVILDRFSAGETDSRAALRQIGEWRGNAANRIETVRGNAANLRAPPSLALLGPSAVGLDRAMATARRDLPALLDEIASMLDAVAAMGSDAIRNPEKGIEARERAIYGSVIQLIRIDLRRIDANIAALSADHPNRPIMRATQIYYSALMLIPQHEVDVMNGVEPGPIRVAAGLRLAAQDMRTQTAQCAPLAQRTIDALRTRPAPSGSENIIGMIGDMMATFPDTVRAYNGVADALDGAAAHIEAGGEVADASEVHDAAALPYLREIERLEQVRANLAATIGRRGGV